MLRTPLDLNICSSIPWIALTVSLLVPHRSQAQDSPPDPVLANSIVTVEAVVGSGIRWGSGVLLLDSDLVLTSYQQVRGATKARVRLADAPVIEVAGVVAANQATDLVLIKLKRGLPNGTPLRPSERIPQVGDSVWMHAAQRIDAQCFAHTQVRAVRGGAEQELAWNAKPGDLHRAARWISLKNVLPQSALGGGLFDTESSLVRVLTAPREQALSVSHAVDASSIRNLLRNVSENPIALSRLTGNHVGDPERLPQPAKPATLPPEIERRTMPVADRLNNLAESIAEGEEVLSQVKQAIDSNAGVLAQLQAQILQTRNRISLEQSQYQKILRNPEDRKITRRESSRGKKGRDDDKVEARVHSALQKARLSELESSVNASKRQLMQMDQEVRVLQSRLQFHRFEQQACERNTIRLGREIFWWADPLELRPDSHAQQLLRDFSDRQFTGRLAAHLFLARAQAHLRLRDFSACEASLDETLQVSGSERALVDALRARAKALGSKIDAKTAGPSAGKSGGKGGGESRGPRIDDRLLAVQVRDLLDREEFRKAAQLLLPATRAGDVDADLFAALSLLYSTTDAGIQTRKNLALPLAREALERTGGREWPSRAAAAAALAHAKETGRAQEWLTFCENLPENERRSETMSWRRALQDNQPWSFRWAQSQPRQP